MVLAKMSHIDWITKEQFVEWMGGKEFGHMGINRAETMLTDMEDRELVEVKTTKRSGTRALKWYRRKD